MKWNSIFLSTLAALLGLAFAPMRLDAQDLGDTVSAPGLFSYQAPKGWTIKEVPNFKYKIVLDAPKDNFPANINVVLETFPGSLDDYVEQNKTVFKNTTAMQNVQIVEDKAFTTTDGTVGIRLIVTDTYNKTDLRQVFYFFAGTGDNKFIVTTTCLPADADKYGPIFDASMKTFSLK